MLTMPSPLRRWRPLIVTAAILLTLGWYVTNSLDYAPVVIPSPQSGNIQFHNEGDVLRWSKRPDRYPVTSLRPLPTGRPAVSIPKIQKSPPPEESVEARRLRQKRLAKVKESFVHSWKGYKDNAWLQDEVAPLTKQAKSTFGGWAATLVDALDTLWIMGLKDDFAAAAKACEKIDFAFTTSPSLNVFETTIRYLGGFLAAYEISGKKYHKLLDKAVEVGELLMCAFDTPNRLPISRWDWQRCVLLGFYKLVCFR